MKKLTSILLAPIILSACAVQKNLPPQEPQIIKDTVYVEKSISTDTINGYPAYLKAKELQGIATEEFYSGNEKKADSLYKQSLIYLSKSHLKSQDYNFLNLEDQLSRLESYNEIEEKDRNGITVTKEEIEEVLEKEKFPIGQSFAKKVAYHKKRFKTGNNKWFRKTLKRTEKYFPFIDSLLKEKDLDPFIKWMYPIESGMNPDVNSRVGARGLAQFMTWTGKEYGLNIYGNWCDERTDPKKSIEASVNYMAFLTNLFQDPALAIASYNAGPGRIKKRINQFKASSYNELLDRGLIPRETAHHLPKIYAYMELAKETNLTSTKKDKILENIFTNNFDTISIKRQTDLGVIAKAAGISERELKKYNPAYKMWSTPPKYLVKNKKYDFTMRLPKGKKENFYEKLSKMNPLPKQRTKYYRVKSGDNLGAIGRKFKVGYKTIMRANKLSSTRIKAGQKLIIPKR